MRSAVLESDRVIDLRGGNEPSDELDVRELPELLRDDQLHLDLASFRTQYGVSFGGVVRVYPGTASSPSTAL